MRLPLITTSLVLATALVAQTSAQTCGGSRTAPSTRAAATRTAQKAVETSQDLVDVAASAGRFKTLVAAVEAAGLVDALMGRGPFTVFAPVDSAFAALPEGTLEDLLRPGQRDTLAGILTFHVVRGRLEAAQVLESKALTTLNGQRLTVSAGDDGVRIEGARVVTTDIEASNGIIHVIDSVMLPASDDIVSIAVADGRFRTLAAALKAAELVDDLQGDGPFTVFAPTDEAFAQLPEGTVASLLEPENREKLISILTYHVVPGRVFSDQAAQASRAASLQGKTLSFARDRAGITVNGSSKVLIADLEASNGVIHVIDSVLLPE